MKEVKLTQRGWLRMKMIKFQKVDKDEVEAEDEAEVTWPWYYTKQQKRKGVIKQEYIKQIVLNIK